MEHAAQCRKRRMEIVYLRRDKRKLLEEHYAFDDNVDCVSTLDSLFAKTNMSTSTHFGSNIGDSGEEHVFNVLKELCVSKSPALIHIFNLSYYECENCQVLNPDTMTETYSKASNCSKADLILRTTLRDLKVSVKFFKGQPPSILNHTPRSAMVFQSGSLTCSVPALDTLIARLNLMRINGTFSEDIYLKEVEMLESEKRAMENVFSYFLFKGAGSRYSTVPADFILEVGTMFHEIEEWQGVNCSTEEQKLAFVKSIMNRVVLSIRNKQMPTARAVKANPAIADQVEPWIFHPRKYVGDTICGSLHLRLVENGK